MESIADDEKPNEVDPKTKPADQERAENKNMGTIDEESDDDEDYQVPEADIEVPNVLDQTMNQNPWMLNLVQVLHFAYFILILDEKQCNLQEGPNKSDGEAKHIGLFPTFSNIPAFSYLLLSSSRACVLFFFL